MNTLQKLTDEELLDIFDADLEKEIQSRGYEYGWHKQISYAGVIYILVNNAFPKLVKIGYSDNVQMRIKTLNNSGLPEPYHVYATYKVKNRLEDLALHRLIDSLDSGLRYTQNKEFYMMTAEKAYGILQAIAKISGTEELLVWNPLNDPFIDTMSPTIPPGPTPPPGHAPKLTFQMLAIPVGSELVYKDNNSIRVTTTDDANHVKYKGDIYSLSGLAKTLRGTQSEQGGKYFMFNGKTLTVLREEMEKEHDS